MLENDTRKIEMRKLSSCHLERSEDELRERSEPMRVQVSVGNAEISYDFWIAFERKVNMKISLCYDV